MRSKDETLKQELEKEGKKGEYMSLNPNIVPKTYAPNSKFYGEVMEDGYVFNPFIHRRWLPAQFEKLMNARNSAYTAITDPITQIKKSYSYGYSIRFTANEVNKLITLQKHDLAAYEERRQFFDVATVKGILRDYLIKIQDILGEEGTSGYYCYALNNYVKDSSEMFETSTRVEKCSTYSNFFRDTNNPSYYKRCVYDYSKTMETTGIMLEKLNRAKTYYDIYRVIDIMPKLFNTRETESYRVQIGDNFAEAFWKSGAYYTIKHKIMFEHKKMEGLIGADACAKLREHLDNGYTAEQFQEIYDSLE